MPRNKVYKYGLDKKRSGISSMILKINNMPNVPKIKGYDLSESLHLKDMNEEVNKIDFMRSKEYSYIKKLYDSVSSTVSQSNQNICKNNECISIEEIHNSDKIMKDEGIRLPDQIIQDDVEPPSFDYYKSSEQESAIYDICSPVNAISYDPFTVKFPFDLDDGIEFFNLGHMTHK